MILLYSCGHFTENILLLTYNGLSNCFSDITFDVAKENIDVVSYYSPQGL